MQTISELRQLCQATRPAIYADFLSTAYYRVSIYFTWICLQLRMSANQVTVLSGVVAIAGGLLIGSDSPWLVVLGAVCFHLFAILDMSDGEVARYRKQGGVAGHYLDWYMHFISSTSLMVGLFLASIGQLTSPWLIVIGLLAVVMPILDKSVQNAGWTVICWTRLRDIKNNADGACAESQNVEPSGKTASTPQPSWLYRRLRFLMLAPLQDHWAPLILLLIAVIDLFVSFTQLGLPDYRFVWLLYAGVIGPVYLYFRVRQMVQSQALQEGYRRLVCPSRPMKFPQDDFLG
jgi:hypothetical protein